MTVAPAPPVPPRPTLPTGGTAGLTDASDFWARNDKRRGIDLVALSLAIVVVAAIVAVVLFAAWKVFA